jgi:hypothetical protein
VYLLVLLKRNMNNVISHSWLQFWNKNCKKGRKNLELRRKFGLGRRNSGRRGCNKVFIRTHFKKLGIENDRIIDRLRRTSVKEA